MIKVGIIGANGYLGLELLRLLKVHPKVKISKILKRESLIEDEFTHLSGFSFNDCLTSNLSDFTELDCIFISLPHGHSYEYVKELLGKTKIIDLGADSRITDKSLYSQYYSNDMDPNIQKHFTYGFIERDREIIKKASNIANPGCFALCTQLALLPFNEIINFASITAITGSSGGGKEPSSKNHHSKRAKDMFSYGINSHRHLAEIYQSFPHLSKGISFVPTSGPFVRGIFLTAHINLKQNLSNDDVLNLLQSKYNKETFVRIQNQVNLSNIIGSNFCDISIKQTSPSSIVIQSSLDNLMKGASGNAVECFNLMHNLNYNEGVGNLVPFYI